ncbi:MAG: exo-alpha-sialidase [Verrucomicrobiae bacterium]|nr:exo-alpha-sialidase [Verrucomicrobiae bacterium]
MSPSLPAIIAVLLLGPLAHIVSGAEAPYFRSELLFPLQPKHVHSSSIVECPNGDLWVAWFHGSGERKSPDVVIQGARRPAGGASWSRVFPLADTPHLPDCNPVLFVDPQGELNLFWIAVLGESWNHCLLRYRKSKDYAQDGAPNWYWQDDLIPTPGPEFVAALERDYPRLSLAEADYGGHATPPGEALIEAVARDPGKRQLGLMPRTHLLTPARRSHSCSRFIPTGFTWAWWRSPMTAGNHGVPASRWWAWDSINPPSCAAKMEPWWPTCGARGRLPIGCRSARRRTRARLGRSRRPRSFRTRIPVSKRSPCVTDAG